MSTFKMQPGQCRLATARSLIGTGFSKTLWVKIIFIAMLSGALCPSASGEYQQRLFRRSVEYWTLQAKKNKEDAQKEWDQLQKERNIHALKTRNVEIRWLGTMVNLLTITGVRDMEESKIRAKESDAYWEWVMSPEYDKAKQKYFRENNTFIWDPWKYWEQWEGRKIREQVQKELDELRHQYINNIEQLSKHGFKDPDTFKRFNRRQEEILNKYRKACYELEWYKNLKPEQITEDNLFILEVAENSAYVNVKETKNLEFHIEGGKPPYKLTLSSSAGENNQTKTFESAGNYTLPFKFTETGNRTLYLEAEDSNVPRNKLMSTVVYYVREPVAKPPPARESTPSESKLELEIKENAIYLDVNETKDLGFTIRGGKPPYQLRTITLFGSEGFAAPFAAAGNYTVPFKFTEAGNCTVDIEVSDENFPKQSKMATVVFFVREPTSKSTGIKDTSPSPYKLGMIVNEQDNEKLDFYVDVNETKSLSVRIFGGKPPYQLTTSTGTGEDRQTRTFTDAGTYPISFKFSEAGNRTAYLELEDDNLPRGVKAVMVVFLVREPTGSKPAAMGKKQWALKDVKISRPVHVLWNQTSYREEAALQKTSATQTGRSWDKEDTHNWTLNFKWNEPPAVLSPGDSFSITFEGNAQGSPQEKCKYSKIAYTWRGFAVTVNGKAVEGTRDIWVGMTSTKEWVPSRSETATFTVPENASELAIYVCQTDDFVEFLYERKD